MKLSAFLSVAIAFAFCSYSNADIMLTNFGPAYTQNFDTLATSGSSTTLPADWYFVETGGVAANTSYTADAGGTSTGNTYSYGTGTNTDRALGSLTSTAITTITMGAEFQNVSTAAMTKLYVSYIGEQWRRGAAETLNFQISTNATSLTTGTWTDFNAWDFNTIVVGTGLALDGNALANRTTINGGNAKLVLPTAVAPGGNFWIRWVDIDVSGVDTGFGLESISVQGIPEPSTFALCGVLAGAFGVTLVRRRKRA